MERTGVPGMEESPLVDPRDCWKRVGFPQFALEYWCLATFILDYSFQLIEFDMNGDVSDSAIATALSRYDDSDMSQVHGLVNMLEGMTLGQ